MKFKVRMFYHLQNLFWGFFVLSPHKILSPDVTFTSLSQVEESIKQCELRRLNLDDEEVWSKTYLPAVRIADNPGDYEGRTEFRHVQVRLISSKEPLLGCGVLPDCKSDVFTQPTTQKITCAFGDVKLLPVGSGITKQDRQKEGRDTLSTWIVSFTLILIYELLKSNRPI